MRYFVFWIALFITCGTCWIYTNFGSPLIEQIIFQIAHVEPPKDKYPVILLRHFIRDVIITPIFLTIIIYIYELLYSRVIKDIIKFPGESKFLSKYFFQKLHLWVLLFSLIYVECTFSISFYIKSLFNRETSYIGFINPKNMHITGNNSKNLILIYAESYENLFRDKKYYQRNLLHSLDDLNALSFNNFYQLPGTGWTIAAMYASQCGEYITLNFLNDNSYCLSDVLNANGYHNVYMQGASRYFTHTGTFLKKHKYHEVYGREEWQKLGFSNMSEWGLHDDDLFQQAKLKLKELSEKNQPFMLTLLTVDTHCPHGFISDYCKSKHLTKYYEDLLECDADLISEFVKSIIAEGYLENTNIVILGDHLYPLNRHIPENYPENERSILNKFISKDDKIKLREDIKHFDIYPSILKFLGFEFEGDNLALGKSAF